ncbi:MAG TPA: pirin family protein [Candidatus Kapabacteria bacterium]|nr:pirin family protein [Candidatus Kapabacteria bacterium]
MITIRKANERGHVNWGWLDTHHTFSFADYHDDSWVHFRTLRVMNEDKIASGQGFGMHPHRDMEIITYVLGGAVEHEDSMGNKGVIAAGDVQRMTAGTGVFHSEFNPFDKELYLYQIWIFPNVKNLTPSYEQKRFEDADKKNRLRLVASSDGADGSVTINQDAKVFASMLDKGENLNYDLSSGRGAWLQVISGSLSIGGNELSKGDGAAITDETKLSVTANENSHFLLFDLN